MRSGSSAATTANLSFSRASLAARARGAEFRGWLRAIRFFFLPLIWYGTAYHTVAGVRFPSRILRSRDAAIQITARPHARAPYVRSRMILMLQSVDLLRMRASTDVNRSTSRLGVLPRTLLTALRTTLAPPPRSRLPPPSRFRFRTPPPRRAARRFACHTPSYPLPSLTLTQYPPRSLRKFVDAAPPSYPPPPP